MTGSRRHWLIIWHDILSACEKDWVKKWEIYTTTKQSYPRLTKHLELMAKAGFLERARIRDKRNGYQYRNTILGNDLLLILHEAVASMKTE